MAKPNYHQARRQKEIARKTRQQEKQQKRQAAKAAGPDGEVADPDPEALSAVDPVSPPAGETIS